MAHKAFMEMIKGKPFEVVGKLRHRQEAKFNSENSTFMDSAIDYIEDTEELEWMDWLAALLRQDAVREANAQAEREAVERKVAQAEPQMQPHRQVEEAHGPPEHVL